MSLVGIHYADLVFRFLVSGLAEKGFTDIKALELWLVAGGKGGFEFAIDDLLLNE